MEEITKKCTKCGEEKSIDEFHKHIRYKDGLQRCCKICRAKYKKDHYTPSANKLSSTYMGINVAEKLLSQVFPPDKIKRMPPNNPGFDFICGKGWKVDSKSGSVTLNNGKNIQWRFYISRNTTAGYFACIAFDDRKSLNPIHFWLIPGVVLNHLTTASISQTTLHKWKKYEKPIDKILKCCDIMKGEK